MQFPTTCLTLLALATFTVSAPVVGSTRSINARQTGLLSGVLPSSGSILPAGSTEGDDAMNSGVATVGNTNGAAAGAANNGSTAATTSQCGELMSFTLLLRGPILTVVHRSSRLHIRRGGRRKW